MPKRNPTCYCGKKWNNDVSLEELERHLYEDHVNLRCTVCKLIFRKHPHFCSKYYRYFPIKYFKTTPFLRDENDKADYDSEEFFQRRENMTDEEQFELHPNHW